MPSQAENRQQTYLIEHKRFTVRRAIVLALREYRFKRDSRAVNFRDDLRVASEGQTRCTGFLGSANGIVRADRNGNASSCGSLPAE